ncbi:MAG: cytochrome c-type biogenesis protein CcmH [Candidatus Lambdaproteobacteria bacterium]|nr:cytochrome c-type biogenesis protein CcmH [Candidatus Lambdaproteobacteria bacterium]
MSATLGGRRLWAVGLLVAVLAIGGALSAQVVVREDPLDAEVRRIADMFRCPTCQAISVNDSEAAFSVQIKDKVRRMLLEGQSEEQIKDYFVSRYGEWILRAPKKQGLGLVLWVLPGGAVLGFGVWILNRAARRARDVRTARAGGGADDLTPEQRQRIERDLGRFEEGV